MASPMLSPAMIEVIVALCQGSIIGRSTFTGMIIMEHNSHGEAYSTRFRDPVPMLTTATLGALLSRGLIDDDLNLNKDEAIKWGFAAIDDEDFR